MQFLGIKIVYLLSLHNYLGKGETIYIHTAIVDTPRRVQCCIGTTMATSAWRAHRDLGGG